jgi:uncharacterized membrane protein YidH (DUF202 family)
MSIEFVSYLLIVLIFIVIAVIFIYFGWKYYNDKDPVRRTYSKIWFYCGVGIIIGSLLILVDAWHS